MKRWSGNLQIKSKGGLPKAGKKRPLAILFLEHSNKKRHKNISEIAMAAIVLKRLYVVLL
jgi:hypothetical protein